MPWMVLVSPSRCGPDNPQADIVEGGQGVIDLVGKVGLPFFRQTLALVPLPQFQPALGIVEAVFFQAAFLALRHDSSR